MHRPHTARRHRTANALTVTALTALLALSTVACSGDGDTTRPVDSAAPIESAASNATTPVRSPASESTTSEAAPTTVLEVVLDDSTLARNALLIADDLGDGWEVLSPEFNFPNGADLARTVAGCEQFAELVFQGGNEHGAGASSAFASGENLVFTYVVVFPTVDAASAMSAAVESPAFDSCWARFNEAAVTEVPFDIESGVYAPGEPPTLSFEAHDSTVKYLEGSFVMGGATIPDTCVCVFAQVGRALVEVHSAAHVLDETGRSEVVQTAVDRLRTTLGAPPLDVAGLLDAVASDESDIGNGVNYVTDQVGQGRYDAGYRRRQQSIEACSSIERPLPLGATYDESVGGRGWLYVDLESPQLPYVGHSVMFLADEAAARQVMADLRAATDLADCVSAWVTDVNGDDAGSRNAPWASSTIEYTVLDAGLGEGVEELGDDQLSITWQQHLTIDGVETAPEEMTFRMARFGAVIFSFSGNDSARTAATAAVLAARTRDALS